MSLSSPWIFRSSIKPKASIRLFCFPHSGAGAYVFKNWDFQKFSELDIEVCAIRLPGHEGRFKEAAFNRFQPLISALASALLPYLDRPYAFFGHSLGAMICFEWARQLRREGRTGPDRLFVSARRAPQLLPVNPFSHTLTDADLKTELRDYDGTPEAVLQNSELMDLFLPVLRADLAVNETYTYVDEAPLDCPISAFGGIRDDKVSVESIEAWANQTSKTFKVRFFSGGHFFIKHEVDSILEAIAHDLEGNLVSS
ncbi:alpha/beta fold hydrolase [Leptothoe sp. EHU-05/26/07-4]